MEQDPLIFLELFGEVREEYISQSAQPWERRRGVHSYHLGRKVACLALFVMLGFCFAFHDQVYAAILRFTTMIGETLSLTKDLTPYTEIIGQTQTQGDLSLTLNEVILDERHMFASFDADYGDRKIVPRFWIDDRRTQINRISYPCTVATFSPGGDPELIEEYGMDNIVLGLSFADLELPEGKVNVHLVVKAGEYLMTDTENWSAQFRDKAEKEFIFDFVFSDEELRAQTIRKELDLTVSDEDGVKLKFTELTMNDLYCMLGGKKYFSWDDPWVQEHELRLIGEDSFGNPVSLSICDFIEDEIYFETNYDGGGEAGLLADGEEPGQPLIPDKDCAYLDLQLYRRQVIEPEWDPTEEEVYVEYENRYTGLENDGWEPVGEKFRVMVNG